MVYGVQYNELSLHNLLESGGWPAARTMVWYFLVGLVLVMMAI